MRNLFALLGLTKYALAQVYMSRQERRRVRVRRLPFAAAVRAAASSIASIALSLATDARAIGILCTIATRNLWHDAKAAFAGARPRD